MKPNDTATTRGTAHEPMPFHRIVSEHLDVTVNALGAELASLRRRDVGELLWQAEPIWPQHAPNLFPIVGQLAGDRLNIGGRTYSMSRHGFARRRCFDWLDSHDTGCRLVLRDDDATRAVYPFPFELQIGYEVSAATLTVTFVVRNTGKHTLPASLGAHPAFRWPLIAGGAKDDYTLTFERPEPAPIRRLRDGLLELEAYANPIDGRNLALNEQLFATDAIVMDRLASRSVRYAAPGVPAIDVAWRGFRELGIWSKPGAEFLCIEPWRGYASPIDFDGPFESKPGLMLILPEREERLSIEITVADPAPAQM